MKKITNVKRINKRKKGGFTLIELIISLAIMAVIALIALPNLNSIKESSKIKADRQSAESIKRTIQLLIVDDTIKVGDSAIELTYEAKDKVLSGELAAVNEEVLKKALIHVNPPATNKEAPYLVNINNGGDDVVVKVQGEDETSTGATIE